MTTTGRAAVFEKVGEPMEIREFPVLDPKPGHAVVKLTRANVCGSDLHLWRGEMGFGRDGSIPVILGHEMTGRIHKCGQGRDTDSLGRPLKEGDRVVFSYYRSCGSCLACLRGDDNHCFQSMMSVIRPCEEQPHFFGGFADYYVVGEGQALFKVPDELDDGMVAGANCALSQVIYGLLEADLRFGETVVIQGAGGLGTYATCVAREMGAGRVIVVDGVEDRLALAKRMGADDIIDMRELTDPRGRTQQVKNLTDGWGADVVVEVVGRPEAMPEGIRMMGRGGRYVTLGNITPKATYKEDPSILVGGNLSIVGRSLYPPLVLKRAVDFLQRAKDRYPLGEVTETYSLENINQAFEDADQFAQSGKSMVRASIDLAA